MIGCYRGCNKADILAAVGLEMRDLFDNEGASPKTGDAPKRQITAIYDYRSETDELLYQKIRFSPKGFAQRRPDPKSRDGWLWSLGDVRRVLYRLPDIISHPDHPVILTEGEADADNVAKLGLLATTNTEGAGHAMSEAQKWRDEYSDTLRGRRVVIIPDNDGPGMSRAYFIAGALMVRGVESIRVLALPGLLAGGDASDWIAKGGTRDQLVSLILATPAWRPAMGRVA